MNISDLFKISLKLLLDENSTSGVNGSAGKGLMNVTVENCQQNEWVVPSTDEMCLKEYHVKGYT